MKSIIVLIEKDNGERYDDYMKWVDQVYEVETDLTGEELDALWKKQIVELMEQNSIDVNPHWLNIMNPTGAPISKAVTKLYRRLIKDNSFCLWLERNYKTRKREFKNIHVYNYIR